MLLREGSVDYQKTKRAKNVITEANEFCVMTTVFKNSQIDGRQLRMDLEMCGTNIRWMLQKSKFNPYHIQLNVNQDFLKKTMFSNGSTFHKNGFVNNCNMHYYANKNSYFLLVDYSQWALNVYARLWQPF